MTTVVRSNHLKLKINDNDHLPPHVHIEGMGATVRINLVTLEVMDPNTDFSLGTLSRIIGLVKKHRNELMEVWNDKHPKR